MHPDLWNEPPEFFRWLERVKAKGFCTYEEVSEILYTCESLSDKMDRLLELLADLAIEVRDEV